MLALQVRVAPSFLVAACLSDSRLNVRSKTQNHNNSYTCNKQVFIHSDHYLCDNQCQCILWQESHIFSGKVTQICRSKVDK